MKDYIDLTQQKLETISLQTIHIYRLNTTF